MVQIDSEPIGNKVNEIRAALSWPGKCITDRAQHSTHLIFKFAPEAYPEITLKLKVEINTREHESLYGFINYPFEVIRPKFF